MRAELARFGPQAGLAELVERWPAAVGEAIARSAWPARIGRDGTVHVSTADSVWAFELGHRATEIARRLGVEKLRFAPGPLPGPDPPPPSPPSRPTGEQERAAASVAAAIEAGSVREAVQKAVGFWFARGASDRPV